MATNGANNVEDAEMADCDGEKVVTMMDVLQEEQDFEDDANAVLGASDEKNCTYAKGYIKRQAIYACMTCCPETKDDPTKRAGVCLACSLNCHENHDLVELYTKRNFRCDCGNPKFNSHPCQFTSDKSEINVDNTYNQNFSGLYCNCHRPYPDPESTVEDDEMIQCIICEDWLHSSHLDAPVPGIEQYSEMVCKACMESNEFLHDYSSLAVNVEMGEIDVTTINGANATVSNGVLEAEKANESTEVPIIENVKLSNGDLEAEKSVESAKVPVESISDLPKVGMDIDEEPVVDKKTTEIDDATVNSESTVNQEADKILEENNEIIAEAEKKEDLPQDPSDVNTDSTGDENTNINTEESTKVTENLEESAKVTENLEESTNVTENLEESTKITEETSESQNVGEDSAEHEESKETLSQKENEPLNTTTEVNQETNDTKQTQDSADADLPESAKPEETSESTEVNEPTTSEAQEPMSSETSEDNIAKVDQNSEDLETNSKESDKNENDQSTTKNVPEITPTDTKLESTMSNDIKMDVANIAENKESKASSTDTSNVESTETENPLIAANDNDSVSKLDTNETPQNGDINGDEPTNSIETSDTLDIEESKDKKRKISTEEITDENFVKKPKLDAETCSRPKGVKRVHKGATFWPSNFRQKLCTCCECLSMYKDLSVLFLIDLEDTVLAYETLGKERVDGRSSQYEKGLEALSSLDRVQQINALTEYNKMKEKLLDFLKSFKDRKEIVKEEDIKAFFAGMKPKREPDGVYFCR